MRPVFRRYAAAATGSSTWSSSTQLGHGPSSLAQSSSSYSRDSSRTGPSSRPVAFPTSSAAGEWSPSSARSCESSIRSNHAGPTTENIPILPTRKEFRPMRRGSHRLKALALATIKGLGYVVSYPTLDFAGQCVYFLSNDEEKFHALIQTRSFVETGYRYWIGIVIPDLRKVDQF